MKKLIISIIAMLGISMNCNSQLLYYSDNAPNVNVTVAPSCIVVSIDGVSSMVLFPQGFSNNYMHYSEAGIDILFSTDLTTMFLNMGGQTYQYTLSMPIYTAPAAPATYPTLPTFPTCPAVPYYNYGTPDNYYYDNSDDKAYYRAEIRELKRRIRDAERSLHRYERYNRRDPSITSSQLVQSQRRLINTYYERLRWLESQLY